MLVIVIVTIPLLYEIFLAVLSMIRAEKLPVGAIEIGFVTEDIVREVIVVMVELILTKTIFVVVP